MKKLYNHKGKIHPSPPPSTTQYHHLSLLPITIATLAATLPPQDQQVLAYLLSISTTTGQPTTTTTTKSSGDDHVPQFNCNCFRCYTTFWVRWDSSPNRKVIHEIIDAYEDKLIHNKKHSKNKKDRKYNNNNKCLTLSSSSTSSLSGSSSSSGVHAPPLAGGETTAHEGMKMEQSKMNGEDEVVTMSSEKGSVRKIVNFIGERIWGVWGV